MDFKLQSIFKASVLAVFAVFTSESLGQSEGGGSQNHVVQTGESVTTITNAINGFYWRKDQADTASGEHILTNGTFLVGSTGDTSSTNLLRVKIQRDTSPFNLIPQGLRGEYVDGGYYYFGSLGSSTNGNLNGSSFNHSVLYGFHLTNGFEYVNNIETSYNNGTTTNVTEFYHNFKNGYRYDFSTYNHATDWFDRTITWGFGWASDINKVSLGMTGTDSYQPMFAVTVTNSVALKIYPQGGINYFEIPQPTSLYVGGTAQFTSHATVNSNLTVSGAAGRLIVDNTNAVGALFTVTNITGVAQADQVLRFHRGAQPTRAFYLGVDTSDNWLLTVGNGATFYLGGTGSDTYLRGGNVNIQSSAGTVINVLGANATFGSSAASTMNWTAITNVYGSGGVFNGPTLTVNPAATFSSNASFNANLTIGDAATDVVTWNSSTNNAANSLVFNTPTATFSNTVKAASYQLSDGSDKNHSLSVYAAGTAYALTATPALLDFGTTDPSLTINKAGTYLITARVNLLYNGATFAASRAVTIKLRRTNNTAADLSNGTSSTATSIVTTETSTFMCDTFSVLYTTTNTDDIIQLFGDVAVVPSAGSLDATQASIVAIRLTNP